MIIIMITMMMMMYISQLLHMSAFTSAIATPLPACPTRPPPPPPPSCRQLHLNLTESADGDTHWVHHECISIYGTESIKLCLQLHPPCHPLSPLYANSANGGSRSAEQPDVTSVSSALLTAIDPLLLLQAERALQAHLGNSYATEVPPQL